MMESFVKNFDTVSGFIGDDPWFSGKFSEMSGVYQN